jgi:hypothetical protein
VARCTSQVQAFSHSDRCKHFQMKTGGSAKWLRTSVMELLSKTCGGVRRRARLTMTPSDAMRLEASHTSSFCTTSFTCTCADRSQRPTTHNSGNFVATTDVGVQVHRSCLVARLPYESVYATGDDTARSTLVTPFDALLHSLACTKHHAHGHDACRVTGPTAACKPRENGQYDSATPRSRSRNASMHLASG